MTFSAKLLFAVIAILLGVACLITPGDIKIQIWAGLGIISAGIAIIVP